MTKIALITGCSSGIGEYIATKYLQEGYEVIGLDINKPQEVLNNSFQFYQVNLKDESATADVFKQISKIDLAINCAGISSIRKPILDFDSTEIINAIHDNFLPCFNAMQNELKIMQQQGFGKIVNIASIAGHIGMKNFLGYGAAKAAIINATKVAAIEHAKDNIRVNSISPATIDTPMIRKKYNGQLKDYSNTYYTRSCGNPSDVYSIVKMLEDNNFITGQDIKLDGGLIDLFVI